MNRCDGCTNPMCEHSIYSWGEEQAQGRLEDEISSCCRCNVHRVFHVICFPTRLMARLQNALSLFPSPLFSLQGI